MNYELKNAVAQGLPFTDPNNDYVLPTIIYTGIVGQTYGGFQNVDVANCTILKTDSVDEIEVKMNAFATAYVAMKYPNT